MIANGGLPDPDYRDQMMAALQTSPDPGAFVQWQQHAAQLESMNVSETLRNGLAGITGAAIELTDAEAIAYDAPNTSWLVSLEASANHTNVSPTAATSFKSRSRMLSSMESSTSSTKPILGKA